MNEARIRQIQERQRHERSRNAPSRTGDTVIHKGATGVIDAAFFDLQAAVENGVVDAAWYADQETKPKLILPPFLFDGDSVSPAPGQDVVLMAEQAP